MNESQKRLIQFSLGGIFALVTTVAIVTNFAMTDPTQGPTSVLRLMVASAFLASGTSYLALRIKVKSGFRRFVTVSLWVIAVWGAIIFLCTSSVSMGLLLFQILGSP